MAINTVIFTNVMALTAHTNLGTVGNRQKKANQRLSSGKKINSAADDAAGLAISEKMKAQIKGLDMAAKNSEDAISLIQTAEGSLTEVNNMLTRIRELAVQAGNDTNQQEDRVKISEEVASLLTEIDSISSRTEFNEKKLNDGSFQNGHFQIGANSEQKLELSINNMSVNGIGVNEIMDTFGIEKTIDLTVTSSVKGVVSGGIAHQVKSGSVAQTPGTAGQDPDAIGGTLTLTVINNVTRLEETITFNFSQKIGAGTNAADSAAAIVAGLKNNSMFTDRFNIENDGDKLVIEGKNVGEDYTITKVGVSLTDKDGNNLANSGISLANVTASTSGYYNKINLNNLPEDETVTICGKTFIKVAKGNPKGITNGFSAPTELIDLLSKEGIVTTSSRGELILKAIDHQDSRLEGKYAVNEKEVSDKGKDYSKALDIIDESLKHVTTQRAKLGANQNRLEYTINSLNLSSENLTAAKSRIEDTDMAKEMMNLTSANVLQQAATSILAQANQAPNNITQLLG